MIATCRHCRAFIVSETFPQITRTFAQISYQFMAHMEMEHKARLLELVKACVEATPPELAHADKSLFVRQALILATCQHMNCTDGDYLTALARMRKLTLQEMASFPAPDHKLATFKDVSGLKSVQ